MYFARMKGAGTSTPWGVSQYSHPIIRGAVFYGTEGHGGMRVSERLAEKMSEYAKRHSINQNGAFWFEEDCAISLALYEFLNIPQYAEKVLGWCSKGGTIEEQKARLEETIKRWYSDYQLA